MIYDLQLQDEIKVKTPITQLEERDRQSEWQSHDYPRFLHSTLSMDHARHLHSTADKGWSRWRPFTVPFFIFRSVGIYQTPQYPDRFQRLESNGVGPWWQWKDDGYKIGTRTQLLHIDFEFDLAADYAHCIHPHLHAAVEGIIYASPSDDTTRESEAASTRRTFIPHQFNAYDYGYAHAQTQKNSSTHPLIKLALFALLLINLVNQWVS